MNRLISSQELMKALDINEDQVASLRAKGLKGVRIGYGKWVYFVEDVVKFFEEQVKKEAER